MKTNICIIVILSAIILPITWYAYRIPKEEPQPMTALDSLRIIVEKRNDSILLNMERIEDSLSRKYAYYPKIRLNRKEWKLSGKKKEKLRIEKMRRWIWDSIKDRSILREPVITLDKDPFSKLIQFMESDPTDTIPYYIHVDTKVDSTDMSLNVYGKTLEELKKEYYRDRILHHDIDTLCFGMNTKSNEFIPISMYERYYLLHIHYAEVHRFLWQYRNMKKVFTEIYFIRDGDSLRALKGVRYNEKTIFPI